MTSNDQNPASRRRLPPAASGAGAGPPRSLLLGLALAVMVVFFAHDAPAALAQGGEQQATEVPGPVTGLTLASSADSVTVLWQAPDSGGAPSRYIVHLRPEGGEIGSGRTKTPRAKNASGTFDNLEPGATYKVWVRARNAGGKGERSLRSARPCFPVDHAPLPPFRRVDPVQTDALAGDFQRVTVQNRGVAANVSMRRPSGQHHHQEASNRGHHHAVVPRCSSSPLRSGESTVRCDVPAKMGVPPGRSGSRKPGSRRFRRRRPAQYGQPAARRLRFRRQAVGYSMGSFRECLSGYELRPHGNHDVGPRGKSE